jgi:ubiquitin-conjugating enzyme E2 J1
LKEREEACAEGGGEASEEVVPDELRLAYRDELDKTKGAEAAGDADTGAAEGAESSKKSSDTPPPVQSAPAPAPVPRHTRTGTQPVIIAPGRQQPQDRSLQWIDTGIYGIVAALVFLVLKKFAS